jgi:hypothetical protein
MLKRKALSEIEMHLAHSVGLEVDDKLGLHSAQIICTPVMLVCTVEGLDKLLTQAWNLLEAELKGVKPKRLGHLHVACVVNADKMCYEVALFMPFERDERE